MSPRPTRRHLGCPIPLLIPQKLPGKYTYIYVRYQRPTSSGFLIRVWSKTRHNSLYANYKLQKVNLAKVELSFHNLFQGYLSKNKRFPFSKYLNCLQWRNFKSKDPKIPKPPTIPLILQKEGERQTDIACSPKIQDWIKKKKSLDHNCGMSDWLTLLLFLSLFGVSSENKEFFFVAFA